MTVSVSILALSNIIAERKESEAKNSRRALFDACRLLLTELDGDVAGYAIVAWSKDGELRSAYGAGQGPIKAALVPTLAGDALNRHVALDMAPPVRK